MRLISTRIIAVLTLLFLIIFSMPAHSETEGIKQEELGRAIQQAALLKQHGSSTGSAQEKLGKAIQEAALVSNRVTAQNSELQEQLGRQIQDAAVLQYAQGRTQERIGETLLQMARS